MADEHTVGDEETPYSLPCSAEELYDSRAKHRTMVIETARLMASVTIPSAYPPEGYLPGTDLDESNQSFNAICVNTLASKLMFMALPPDRPVVRFEPIEHVIGQEIKANPKLWTATQVGLNALEQEHRSRLEGTNLRSVYTGAVKQGLIAGNFLWEHLKLDFPVYHRMDNYIVVRNNQGEQLLVILKRCVELLTLDKDLRKQVYAINESLRTKRRAAGGDSASQKYDETIDIYAVCKRRQGAQGEPYWEYWEEYEGQLLEGTEFEADFEDCPLYAFWMIPVLGEDWGRSYCEEFRGDLFRMDNLSSAENDGAAVASLILLFLKAGSRTSPKQIRNARNMSLMTGQADDLTAFHLEKTADFNFITLAIQETAKRLGRAFLLMSSVQRPGERVTAEEWKQMAQEIDQATGGLYSELAQNFQRHAIRRAISLHNHEDKGLPKLPKGVFRVAVVTGIEAMGRTVEGENLLRGLGSFTQLYGPQELLKNTDPNDALRRILVAENVKQDGLVLSAEDIARKLQEQQSMVARQTLLEQGTGPAIQAIAKAGPAMAQQQQQQAAEGEAQVEAP